MTRKKKELLRAPEAGKTANGRKQKMKKVKIILNELINVFEEDSFEIQHFLGVETGEIITLIDEGISGEDDTELREEIEKGFNKRYFRIPEQDSHEEYRDMVRFTETVEDENLQEKLWIALDGKGAFRRFKDVLYDYPEERERWFVFQNERVKQRVLDWLEVNDLELEE